MMETARKAFAEEINPEALSLQEELFRREINAREKQSQLSSAAVLTKKVFFGIDLSKDVDSLFT
jgi:hypothetical protein